MQIDGRFVPQADSLEGIDELVEAVAAGNHSDDEISAAFERVDRQARYYRAASELLGLTRRDGPNNSVLTNAGRLFVQADSRTRRDMLRGLIRTSPLFSRLIPYIAQAGRMGRTRDEVTQFVASQTTLTGTTPDRRYASIAGWLVQLGMVIREDDRLVAVASQISPLAVEIDDTQSSVIVPVPSLTPFDGDPPEPLEMEHGELTRIVELAATERAVSSHEEIRALLAQTAQRAGYVTTYNRYIDLCASSQSEVLIFEIKSTTVLNYHDQTRAALAQLYEYRYIQRLPAARLVAVFESKPPQGLRWILDYFQNERQVLVIWVEDGVFVAEDPSMTVLRSLLG